MPTCWRLIQHLSNDSALQLLHKQVLVKYALLSSTTLTPTFHITMVCKEYLARSKWVYVLQKCMYRMSMYRKLKMQILCAYIRLHIHTLKLQILFLLGCEGSPYYICAFRHILQSIVCVLKMLLKKVVYITNVSTLHKLCEVSGMAISIDHATWHTVSRTNKLTLHNKITKIGGSAILLSL